MYTPIDTRCGGARKKLRAAASSGRVCEFQILLYEKRTNLSMIPDLWKAIYDSFTSLGRLPNRLSIGIGQAIRECREEAGMSQTELAERVYKRRASISDIENGKMYPDIETLTYISRVFQKPMMYFIPERYRRDLDTGEITVEDRELLMVFHRLTESRKIIALEQMKALSGWDLEE